MTSHRPLFFLGILTHMQAMMCIFDLTQSYMMILSIDVEYNMKAVCLQTRILLRNFLKDYSLKMAIL